MTPIQTNKPVFFDLDGEALEGGKIYIGQPSTDPRTSPKTVTFRDSGGAEFTASQPLKTNAGRIVYNGKPITAMVDGDYSLLVLSASNAQIEYSTSVNPDAVAADDFGQLIRVGLTLADIKAYDVNVGETVRNVGKATATDDLGADWLVVSATGNPADDVDLIDFSNGLQGQRIDNVAYRSVISEDVGSGRFKPEDPTQVWTGSSTSVPITDLSETGAGFYVLETNIATVGVYVTKTDGSNPMGGGTFVFGSVSYTAWLTASTPPNFRLSGIEMDSPHSQTLQTITAIYKV